MTHCGRCGDCCEHIPLGYGAFDRLRGYLENFDEEWDLDLDVKADAEFILARWHPEPFDNDSVEGLRYRCDAFDPVSRLCTAREERPPICRNYPWYTNIPNENVRGPDDTAEWMPVRCSFFADVVNESAGGG